MTARARFRLDLYRTDAGWGWRLWSGSDVVSASGRQNYSRRIDCARGAEAGAGVCGVVDHLQTPATNAYRHGHTGGSIVVVRVLDEREVAR